jgi:hypothetical protein
VLGRGDLAVTRADLRATAGFAAWALLFAAALDVYGAAFLPVGPRLPLMALLALGAVPYMLADARLARGAGLGWRLLARALPLAVLLGAMVARPMLGIAFTVLPVVLLFWLVHGLAARWFGRRGGGAALATALGAAFAWALAASTPLVAAG